MQDFKQYLIESLREAGMTDDSITSAIDKIANNEKVSSKLNSLVKTATEDYQAQIGRQRAAEEKLSAAERRTREVEDWYNGVRDAQGNLIKAGAKDEYIAMQNELAALKNGGGNGVPDFDESKFVKREDLAKTITDMANNFGGRMKDILRISTRHAAKFGEELPVDELESMVTQMAKENGGQPPSLSSAYERLIQPRIDKAREEKYQQDLKAAREEGAREALSRHSLPAEPVPGESSPLFARIPKEEIPANTDADLLAAWHSVKK